MKISLPSPEKFSFVLQSVSGMKEKILEFTDSIERKTPVDFCEDSRYLPPSVSPFPGYFVMDQSPYWYEILNCFDPDSPVREVILLKGQGVGFTTNLENIVFYIIGHVKTSPIIYVTADLGLSEIRMENNFLPMFQHSGMMDSFISHDEGNTRKQGIKKKSLQWVGGGYLLPFGAQNANKARQQSIPNILLDEVDGWPMQAVDGSDMLEIFKARGSNFWEQRKIFIGSTPLELESSRIEREYQRGDQRKYMCRCLKCGYPQEIRWRGHNEETGEVFGFAWDLLGNGELDIESVRYHCQSTGCGHAHMEYDKPMFFSRDNAFWEPTAIPKEPNVRSYHLPGFFSMSGMIPWYKGVSQWRAAWDDKNNRVKDKKQLQVFYNNILGRGFETGVGRVDERHASAHRRMWYAKGAIVNSRVSEYCDSPILFLTCTVDVHKNNLAVAIWGWTAGMTCWLVDYKRIRDDSEAGFENPYSEGWAELAKIIETERWHSDDKREYWIAMTLIDTGWNGTIVTDFCAQYESAVVPIVGRKKTPKNSKLDEFGEYTTKIGTTGYIIKVDYYKDRIAPVIRREWDPLQGKQGAYTFNCPVDTTQKELLELTAEKLKEEIHPDGTVTHWWDRTHGVDNELWDLMVYGHASVEIMAWKICVKHFEMKAVDWGQFWEFMKQPGMFFNQG